MRILAALLFKLTGWKAEGELPKDLNSFVIIGVPHTSNWDFLYSRAIFSLLGVPVRFVAKKELFFFPLGYVLRKLGGIPVDRSRGAKVIPQMVDLLKNNDNLALLIPPEGTRKPVKKWKRGFYNAALQADVPIVLGYLDYKEKKAGIGPVIYPSGNYKEDLRKIVDFYRNITPKHPENFQIPEGV